MTPKQALAFVKLAARFDKAHLAKVENEHTANGAHRTVSTPFPKWVPDAVRQDAKLLSVPDAERALAAILPSKPTKRTKKPG